MYIYLSLMQKFIYVTYKIFEQLYTKIHCKRKESIKKWKPLQCIIKTGKKEKDDSIV